MGMKVEKQSLKLIGWQILNHNLDYPECFSEGDIYPLGDCLAWISVQENPNEFYFVPIFEGRISNPRKRGLNVEDPYRLRKFSAEEL